VLLIAVITGFEENGLRTIAEILKYKSQLKEML
jgi:hypothetical protein